VSTEARLVGKARSALPPGISHCIATFPTKRPVEEHKEGIGALKAPVPCLLECEVSSKLRSSWCLRLKPLNASDRIVDLREQNVGICLSQLALSNQSGHLIADVRHHYLLAELTLPTFTERNKAELSARENTHLQLIEAYTINQVAL
jgi:hypothetical protein